MIDDAANFVDRRTVLGAAAGTAATFAGCSALEREEDEATTPVGDDRARDLAERFAPTLYFDADERWFPTDPRQYERERDGETVVDGFAAFDGYTEQFDDEPPDPTVFYNAREYATSPLVVVQYWFYSAFDQFTTNFHWHDWEVLHVYVDTDTGDPQLYVASSHSRNVPNNEFLDPDPDRRPRVLSELGSHSSALSVNDSPDRFQRLPVGDSIADITNSAIDGLEAVAEVPMAYGLPRDEGGRLPFVVPELDGAPVYDHERLPAVDRTDLVPEALTIRSFDELTAPPTNLPDRSTGLVFSPAVSDGDADSDGNADVDADVSYDLAPTADLEHVEEFTGPQLSFEFTVPGPVEDAVASHLTAPGTPWNQPRYQDPATDISEASHRQALSERYDAIGDPTPVNAVVARVTEAVTSPDAPEDEGLTTESSSVEAVALVESDPVAVPTFRGVVGLRDVPDGEHRLTVNGAGLAPHSETVSVGEGATGSGPDTTSTETATDTEAGGATAGEVTAAGVEAEIPLVAGENATKLAVDPTESDDDLTDLAVEDDFAGRLYDAPLSEPDAVYVHRGGAYTTEVRDSDDAVGAFRVNPDDGQRVEIKQPRTGKAPLAEYLADVADETRAEVAAVLDNGDDGDDGDEDEGNDDDDTSSQGGSGDGGDGGDGGSDGGGGGGDGGPENAVRGLARALEAIAEAASRAAERAEAGDRGQADQSLDAVATRLERAGERLAAAQGDLPPGLARAADNRFDQLDRRAEQARTTEKL